MSNPGVFIASLLCLQAGCQPLLTPQQGVITDRLTGLCALLLLPGVLFRNLPWQRARIVILDTGRQRPVVEDGVPIEPYNGQSQGLGHLDL